MWCLTKDLPVLSKGCKSHFKLPEAAYASGEVRAEFRVIFYMNEKMHMVQGESRWRGFSFHSGNSQQVVQIYFPFSCYFHFTGLFQGIADTTNRDVLSNSGSRKKTNSCYYIQTSNFHYSIHIRLEESVETLHHCIASNLKVASGDCKVCW